MRSLVKNVATLVGTIGISAGAVAMPENISSLAPLTHATGRDVKCKAWPCALLCCSWERGLNENTNGLLRQFFPKGTMFNTVTEDEVQPAVTALNHRPRKVLGFKSPYEIFLGETKRYTASAHAVALRT